jgi:hypothetical protein
MNIVKQTQEFIIKYNLDIVEETETYLNLMNDINYYFNNIKEINISYSEYSEYIYNKYKKKS